MDGRTKRLRGLNYRQRAFVEEYIKHFEGQRAARAVGYAYRWARFTASRLLADERIQALIAQRLEEKAMRADEVLARLADQARGDIGDLLAEDGTISLAQAKARGLTHLIKSISDTERGLRVELYSAQSALELIGKHLGLFKDQVEHTGAGGGPIETKDVSDPDRGPVALLMALYEHVRERAVSASGDGDDAVDAPAGTTAPGISQ